jgi:dTDP-4-amino-4,6-dideoxygalactose transaminase
VATPDTARRFASKVPDVIFVAFVVSVVAEGARPVMDDVDNTIGTLDASVTRPVVSSVI